MVKMLQPVVVIESFGDEVKSGDSVLPTLYLSDQGRPNQVDISFADVVY